jgi:hypothetical protein
MTDDDKRLLEAQARVARQRRSRSRTDVPDIEQTP